MAKKEGETEIWCDREVNVNKYLTVLSDQEQRNSTKLSVNLFNEQQGHSAQLALYFDWVLEEEDSMPGIFKHLHDYGFIGVQEDPTWLDCYVLII